jgi:hypothetical protein
MRQPSREQKSGDQDDDDKPAEIGAHRPPRAVVELNVAKHAAGFPNRCATLRDSPLGRQCPFAFVREFLTGFDNRNAVRTDRSPGVPTASGFR